MRILTLTNLYPNPLQPHRAPYNRQQLRALAALHPVRVIAPVAWTDELHIRWRTGQRLPPSRQVQFDGLEVDHPRYYFPPKILRGWYGHCYRRSVRSTFERVLADFRPDLLYAPWAYPDGWAAIHLGRKAGLPVILRLHGSDVLLANQSAGRLRRTREALRQGDALAAVSQDLASRAIELGADPRRTRVLYTGVDLQTFHPGPRDEARHRLGLPQDRVILLFIGNLVPVKGLDVLLRALGHLARQGIEVQCRLIGDGPLRGQLQQQARAEGLAGRVFFLGAKPQAELPDWYRAADLFVLASHSEGVPCVLQEAVACGTPFVATQVGGISEIAPPGLSRLVPPNNPQALASAIAAALREPARAAPPGSWVQSHAEAAAELASFFEEVLRQRRPALAVTGR